METNDSIKKALEEAGLSVPAEDDVIDWESKTVPELREGLEELHAEREERLSVEEESEEEKKEAIDEIDEEIAIIEALLTQKSKKEASVVEEESSKTDNKKEVSQDQEVLPDQHESIEELIKRLGELGLTEEEKEELSYLDNLHKENTREWISFASALKGKIELYFSDLKEGNPRKLNNLEERLKASLKRKKYVEGLVSNLQGEARSFASGVYEVVEERGVDPNLVIDKEKLESQTYEELYSRFAELKKDQENAYTLADTEKLEKIIHTLGYIKELQRLIRQGDSEKVDEKQNSEVWGMIHPKVNVSYKGDTYIIKRVEKGENDTISSITIRQLGKGKESDIEINSQDIVDLYEQGLLLPRSHIGGKMERNMKQQIEVIDKVGEAFMHIAVMKDDGTVDLEATAKNIIPELEKLQRENEEIKERLEKYRQSKK